MSDCSRVRIDLVVVSAFEGLVAKEVNVLVIDAGKCLFGLDMAQTVGLVPACGKDVERDLPADGVSAYSGTICQLAVSYVVTWYG